jgi:hypothetical protein
MRPSGKILHNMELMACVVVATTVRCCCCGCCRLRRFHHGMGARLGRQDSIWSETWATVSLRLPLDNTTPTVCVWLVTVATRQSVVGAETNVVVLRLFRGPCCRCWLLPFKSGSAVESKSTTRKTNSNGEAVVAVWTVSWWRRLQPQDADNKCRCFRPFRRTMCRSMDHKVASPHSENVPSGPKQAPLTESCSHSGGGSSAWYNKFSRIILRLLLANHCLRRRRCLDCRGRWCTSSSSSSSSTWRRVFLLPSSQLLSCK